MTTAQKARRETQKELGNRAITIRTNEKKGSIEIGQKKVTKLGQSRKRANAHYSKRMENNLLAAFRRASTDDIAQGMTWYTTAHAIAVDLSVRHGVTLQAACGVLAALSPGRDWNANITDADTFLADYVRGMRGNKLPRVGSYGRRNIQKSAQIASGSSPLDILGGSKVRSFYANILNPQSAETVTIDRHAKCCAHGIKTTENSVVKPSEYEHLAKHFRKCADKCGVLPNQFQATVWIVWRRLSGVLAQTDLWDVIGSVPF